MATLTEQKLQEVIEQAMDKKVLVKEKEDSKHTQHLSLIHI